MTIISFPKNEKPEVYAVKVSWGKEERYITAPDCSLTDDPHEAMVNKNRDLMEEHAEFIKEEKRVDFDFLPSLKAVFQDLPDWKKLRIKIEVVPLYISV